MDIIQIKTPEEFDVDLHLTVEIRSLSNSG